MDYLPLEIDAQILSYLPLESLLTCRLVNTEFLFLIDHFFVTLSPVLSTTTANTVKMIKKTCKSVKVTDFDSFDCDLLRSVYEDSKYLNKFESMELVPEGPSRNEYRRHNNARRLLFLNKNIFKLTIGGHFWVHPKLGRDNFNFCFMELTELRLKFVNFLPTFLKYLTGFNAPNLRLLIFDYAYELGWSSLDVIEMYKFATTFHLSLKDLHIKFTPSDEMWRMSNMNVSYSENNHACVFPHLDLRNFETFLFPAQNAIQLAHWILTTQFHLTQLTLHGFHLHKSTREISECICMNAGTLKIITIKGNAEKLREIVQTVHLCKQLRTLSLDNLTFSDRFELPSNIQNLQLSGIFELSLNWPQIIRLTNLQCLTYRNYKRSTDINEDIANRIISMKNLLKINVTKSSLSRLAITAVKENELVKSIRYEKIIMRIADHVREKKIYNISL